MAKKTKNQPDENDRAKMLHYYKNANQELKYLTVSQVGCNGRDQLFAKYLILFSEIWGGLYFIPTLLLGSLAGDD